jgi:hypothetical protein
MKFVCDAPDGRTWFRIETVDEACEESLLMQHSLERQFRLEMDKARKSFRPPSTVFFEQEIGLQAHLERQMALFVTLRDENGTPLVTAVLPPGGMFSPEFRPIILGKSNTDPYMRHAECIFALGRHFGLTLERARCYPYPPGRHY